MEEIVADEHFNFDIADMDSIKTCDTIDDIMLDNAAGNFYIILNETVTHEHKKENKENDQSVL